MREPAATFAPTPKLPAADCSRPLEASWLMYWRSCSGVMPVPVPVTDNLRTRPPEAVEPLPVEVPHHTADRAVAERGDRVEPVDSQLAQALKVGALATETLEQEGRVGHRQLMPAIDRRIAVGCQVALRKPAGHLVW